MVMRQWPARGLTVGVAALVGLAVGEVVTVLVGVGVGTAGVSEGEIVMAGKGTGGGEERVRPEK